jgi:galactokinase
MTGAGFGGCAVALVLKEFSDRFMAVVGEAYRQETGNEPQIFATGATDGARIVWRAESSVSLACV